MTITHPDTSGRLLTPAGGIEGAMNIFVPGQIDYGRFKQLTSST